MSEIFSSMIRVCLMAASMLLCGGALAAETVTYFHNDVYGSPVMATDAAGNLLWKESYLPYGDKLTRQPASAGNAIGFHGKALDDNTGLSYMGARYYDPVMGRFRSVDPVGVVPGNLHSFNRFTYANNNPYKYVDPDGRYAVLVARAMTLCAESPSCVAAGAAIAAAMGKAASTVLQSKASPPGGSGGNSAGGEAPPAAAPAAGSPGGANSGDRDPSTPTGQRGSPIEVKPGTNEPTSIGGRDYSGHALDRMQGRGVPPSAVEDAIQNGTPSPGNTPGTTVHTGSNGVTVVTGNGGRVVTVIPR